jgi:hypothetical protein
MVYDHNITNYIPFLWYWSLNSGPHMLAKQELYTLAMLLFYFIFKNRVMHFCLGLASNHGHNIDSLLRSWDHRHPIY